MTETFVGKTRKHTMTETVLFFGLGIAIAGLISILILPVIWKQSSQLTKRKIEATTPINSVEMGASHDLEKAEFAVSIRQLEIRIEELQQQAGNYWYELENSRNQITKLLTEQIEKKNLIDSLQHEISRFQLQNSKNGKKFDKSGTQPNHANNFETEKLLKNSQSEVKQLENQLAVEKSKQLEFDAKLAKLNEQLRESDEIKNSLKLQVSKTTEKLSSLEREIADSKNQPNTPDTSQELINSKKSVKFLSKKLAQTENQLNETQNQLENLTKNVAQNRIIAEQNTIEQMKHLEQELAIVTANRDELKATNTALEARINASPAEVSADVEVGNADNYETTRRKLSEFAAQFVALTANQKEGSLKVPETLDKVSESSTGPVATLSERIRKFSGLIQKPDDTTDDTTEIFNNQNDTPKVEGESPENQI